MEYDGVILKPSLDEALEHYGVQGMKWGRRKRELRVAGLSRRQARRAVKLEKRIGKYTQDIKDVIADGGRNTQYHKDTVDLRNDDRKELKGLMKNANKKYQIKTSRFGNTKIIDQNGKKMSRSNRKFMERQMKSDLKKTDKSKYREYKQNKRAAGTSYTYIGAPSISGYALTGALNAASSKGRKVGKNNINNSVMEYTNKRLSELKKKKK